MSKFGQLNCFIIWLFDFFCWTAAIEDRDRDGALPLMVAERTSTGVARRYGNLRKDNDRGRYASSNAASRATTGDGTLLQIPSLQGYVLDFPGFPRTFNEAIVDLTRFCKDLQGCEQGPSSTFKDLARTFKDVKKDLQGCDQGPSEMWTRTFKDSPL